MSYIIPHFIMDVITFHAGITVKEYPFGRGGGVWMDGLSVLDIVARFHDSYTIANNRAFITSVNRCRRHAEMTLIW